MAIQLPAGSFFGQVQRRCQVGDLTFVESSYPSGLQIPKHQHARPYFYLILQGSCTDRDEHGTWTGGSRTLAFQPAGCAHAGYWLDDGKCLSFEVPPSKLQLPVEQAPLLRYSAQFRSGEAVWLAARLYSEFRRMDDVSPLAMEGLVLEILAEAARLRKTGSAGTPPRWLKQAREFLHDCFPQRLRLNELAGAVGVHPVHLSRGFRKQYGCTLGEYVRKLRVDFASCQLLTTRKTVAEIALAAGFADHSHFTKTFTRHTGLTPVQFRRRSELR